MLVLMQGKAETERIGPTSNLSLGTSLAVASNLAMTTSFSLAKASPTSSKMGDSFLQCPHLHKHSARLDDGA